MDITLQAGQAKAPFDARLPPRQRKSVEIRDLGEGAPSSVCENRKKQHRERPISVCHRDSCRHFNFLPSCGRPRGSFSGGAPSVACPVLRFERRGSGRQKVTADVFVPGFTVYDGKVC